MRRWVAIGCMLLGCAPGPALTRGPEGSGAERRFVDDVEALAVGLRAKPDAAIGDVRRNEDMHVLVLRESAVPVATVRADPFGSCAGQVPRTAWIWFAGEPAIGVALDAPPRAFAFDGGRGCAVELDMPTRRVAPGRGTATTLEGTNDIENADPDAPVTVRREATLTVSGAPVRVALTIADTIELSLTSGGAAPVVTSWSACEISTVVAELLAVADDVYARVQHECRQDVESDHHGAVSEDHDTLVWHRGARAWLPVAHTGTHNADFWDWAQEQQDESRTEGRTWHTKHGTFLHARAREAYATSMAYVNDDETVRCTSATEHTVDRDVWRWIANDGTTATLHRDERFGVTLDLQDCEPLVQIAIDDGRIAQEGALFIAKSRARVPTGSTEGAKACDAIEVDGLDGFRLASEPELRALHGRAVLPDDAYVVGGPPRAYREMLSEPTPERTIVLGERRPAGADATVICVAP